MPTEVTGMSMEFVSQTGAMKLIPGWPGYKDYKIIHWHGEANVLPGEQAIINTPRWRVQHDTVIVNIFTYARIAFATGVVSCQGILDHFLVLNDGLAPPFVTAHDWDSTLSGTAPGAFRQMTRSWNEHVTGLFIPLVEDDQIWERAICSSVLDEAGQHSSWIAAMNVHILEK